MKYKLDIKYTSKPAWLVGMIGIATGYLDGSETFDAATSIIESCLDETIITTRNTKSKGSDLKRVCDYDNRTLVIYNQNTSIICTVKYIEIGVI